VSRNYEQMGGAVFFDVIYILNGTRVVEYSATFSIVSTYSEYQSHFAKIHESTGVN
jgi:hypothetical protein